MHAERKRHRVGGRVRRWSWSWVLAGFLLALVTGCQQPNDPSLAVQASQASAASDSPRTVIVAPAGTADVAFRSCPVAGDAPVGQNPWGLDCHLVGRLADGTAVQMQCWVSTQSPPSEPDGASAKWFSVTPTEGEFTDQTAWVWSDLVSRPQPKADECDHIGHENDPTPPPPPPLTFTVEGTCTPQGGTLTATSSNFTPGGEYSVAATSPDGQPYPGLASPGTVRDDGSVGWTWPCAGDPAGTYETFLVDLSTGRDIQASFIIAAASNATPPADLPTTTTSPPESSAPGSPPPPAPRQITVSNLVTNGATEMREDAPAYLSSQTVNFCATNGCALDGTDVSTGRQLTATCQTAGDRTTNGQDNSSIDDTNPGLDTSTRWYGVRWSDGRFGYISEVWISSADRSGLGLPDC